MLQTIQRALCHNCPVQKPPGGCKRSRFQPWQGRGHRCPFRGNLFSTSEAFLWGGFALSRKWEVGEAIEIMWRQVLYAVLGVPRASGSCLMLCAASLAVVTMSSGEAQLWGYFQTPRAGLAAFQTRAHQDFHLFLERGALGCSFQMLLELLVGVLLPWVHQAVRWLKASDLCIRCWVAEVL